MEKVDIEALEKLYAKATPGEWHAPGIGEVHNALHYELLLANYPKDWHGAELSEEERGTEINQCLGDDDATYACALHNAFPAIVAELRAGRELREFCAMVVHGCDTGRVKSKKILCGELTAKSLEMKSLATMGREVIAKFDATKG